jgi:hypothetical protein
MTKSKPKPIGDFRQLIATFPTGDPTPAKRQPPTNIRAITRKTKRTSK